MTKTLFRFLLIASCIYSSAQAQQPGMKLFDPTGEVAIHPGRTFEENVNRRKLLYREKFITVYIDEVKNKSGCSYFKLPVVTYHLEPGGEVYAELREDGNLYIKDKLTCKSNYYEEQGRKVSTPYFQSMNKKTQEKEEERPAWDAPTPSCPEAKNLFTSWEAQKEIFRVSSSRYECTSNSLAIIADDYQGEWGVIHDATEDGKPLYFKYAESSVPKTHFAYPGARPFDFIDKAKPGAREKMAQKAQELEKKAQYDDPKVNQMMMDFLNGKLPEGENWVSYIEDHRILLLYYDPDHPLEPDDRSYLGSPEYVGSLKLFSYDFAKESIFYTPLAATVEGYIELHAKMWRWDVAEKEKRRARK